MSIDQQIGARGPPPAESRQNKIVGPIFQFIGTCRSRQFGIVDSETAAGSEKAEGLCGCEVVSELQVRVIEAILGETAPRNQAFQVSEVTLADVHQPSSSMRVAEPTFSKELAVCKADGGVKQGSALTARAGTDGQGRSTAVAVTDGISDWHEPEVFDIVSCKQAERGGIGKARDAVEKVRNQDIIHVNTHLFIGCPHHRELGE